MYNSEEDLVREILSEQDSMQLARVHWETQWNEVRDHCNRRHESFSSYTTKSFEGESQTFKSYDDTAETGSHQWANIVKNIISPSSERWHGLTTRIPELKKSSDVRGFYDELTDILFSYRYNGFSNFNDQIGQVYKSLAPYGNACLFVNEDLRNGGILYRCIPLSRIYILENAAGIIDTVHHVCLLTARQAVQEYGIENVSEKIQQAYKKRSNEKFTFVICCKPIEDYGNSEAGAYQNRAVPVKYLTMHLCRDSRKIMRRKPTQTMPYIFCRLETNPGETYGTGPGLRYMRELRKINALTKAQLTVAQNLSQPMILAAHDGIATRFDIKPNSILYGGISPEGRELIKPFNHGSQPQFAEVVLNASREFVRDGFLMNLFTLLVERSNMTATEILKREQERGWILAPIAAKLHEELFQPMVNRELEILGDQGLLPSPPEVLLQYGSDYEINFRSEFARLQNSGVGASIAELLQSALALEQISPGVSQIINADAALEEIALASGAPQKVLRTGKDLQKYRQAEQESKQQAEMMAQAPQAAAALKDLAQAQSLSMAG